MSKLFLIAGPCVVENDKTPFEIGRKVKGICDELGIDYIFKASFKKANRTKLNSFTGIEKEEAIAAKYVDYLQIPAFLCRQTDLLLAAGETGKGVNIKKGQFMSPEAMKFSLEKVLSTGNKNVWLCERGFSFGYEGNPEMIETMALSAIATGADGLFIETHPDPANALSDGQTMLPIEKLEGILKKVMKVRKALES